MDGTNIFPKYACWIDATILPNDTEEFTIEQYFTQYFNDELLNICVAKTNQTAVQKTGFKSLDISLQELRVYFGLCLLMGSIGYPVLRMYWENRWKIPIVAYNMARNRFQLIRNSLKFVFDDEIFAETKAKDKLWKMRPLIEAVQNGCRTQHKSQKITVDEMIVPFTGTCGTILSRKAKSNRPKGICASKP